MHIKSIQVQTEQHFSVLDVAIFLNMLSVACFVEIGLKPTHNQYNHINQVFFFLHIYLQAILYSSDWCKILIYNTNHLA